MKELRILLVCGGSGGHAYPLVAVAQSLREKASVAGISLNLMIMGEGGFIKKAAEENKIPFKIILAGKLRRYPSFQSIFDFLKMPIGFIQSLWYIFWFMPDAVFSKGGYDSVAPAIVSRLYLIPVFIHESDSVPGLANIMISKVSKKVFLSFKAAEKFFNINKVIFTGNPVRKSLMLGDKDVARKFFDLNEARPTVLIMGGSQGAKIINEVILASLIVLTEKFNVIHQCGESQYQAVREGVDAIVQEGTQQYSAPIKKYYRLYPFLDENQLALTYSLSDVIAYRAGAGSLFEIALLKKPSVIIPISQSAGNHQYLNAFEFSLYGGYLIEESNFNRESLMRELNTLLNPEQRAKISERMKIITKIQILKSKTIFDI